MNTDEWAIPNSSVQSVDRRLSHKHGVHLLRPMEDTSCQFVAIDDTSGEVRWTMDLPYEGPWIALTESGDVHVTQGGRDGNSPFVAIDHVTGKEVWRTDFLGQRALLKPGGRAVWLAGRNGTRIVDPRSGRLAAEIGDCRTLGTPSFVQRPGMLLLVDEFWDGECVNVFAFDPVTREERWRQGTDGWESLGGEPADGDGGVSYPTICWVGPYLVIQTDHGRRQRVTVIDPESGNLVARHEYD